MSGHKSEKKGPAIICRVSNVIPEMVCRYVERLPKQEMTEDAFRNYMGKRWFQNEHQAPEQWGLYYIDGTNYYPRFDHNITKEEADAYLYHWMRNLIVINPYTRFKKQCDKKLVDSIVRELEMNPNEHDLKTIIRRIIDSDEPFVIYEIIANALNNYSRVLKVDIINKDEERYNVSLLPNYKELLKTNYNMTKKEYFELFDGVKTAFDPDAPLQKIFYGAPGTGKSNTIKREVDEKKLPCIRTTFHPDSDYSTFVGAYKPTMEATESRVVPVVVNNGISLDQNQGTYTESKITYKFVKQAFMKAYLGAWKKYTDRDGDEAVPQFLVIEEINRGNCAQIFGDLFQLLDRGENRFSEYPIEADTDLQKEIERAFKEEKDGNDENPYKLVKDIEIEGVVDGYTSNYGATLSEDVQHGRVLLLPKNLYIWATMNTSDQSLFPIDSAFKRRWDWEYMPIGYKNDIWKIKIGEKEYKWVDFQKEINKRIYDIDNSEDKQLGDYFVNADRTNNIISSDTLLNKILFYLWNDVCKDDPDQIFSWKDDKDNNQKKSIKFSEFFCEKAEKERKLQGFMAFLEIKADGDDEKKVEQNDDTIDGNDDVLNS